MMNKIYNDEDESIKYDSPPEDDPDEDDIDWEEEEREAILEQEEKKRQNMSNFSQGVFQTASPWTPQTTPNPGQYSPWGTAVNNGTSTWGYQPRPAWTPQPVWAPQQSTPTQGQGSQFVINRQKKVVFCDLLDCLISSLDAQDRFGIPPRGIYDIVIRRDVIDKISCFGPQWVVILTNQGITRGTDSEIKFTRMTDYICACVADLVRLPLDNVLCIMKATLDPYDPCCKPGTGLIELASQRLSKWGIKKSDMIVLGSQSGYQGQSGRDLQMAEAFGVDYIDIQQLLTLYK
jgi:histidinol phosphatase-like enzyme